MCAVGPLELLKEAPALAVVGVSRNKEKYAYKIWQFLKQHGKKVYPVNPGVSEVDGETCYSSLLELPDGVNGVVAVVPHRVTETLPAQCRERGISVLWMQPGAESDAAIAACQKEDIKVVAGKCVMVEW